MEMQKHLLRDCEGFRIKNNSYTIQLWDEYGNQVDGLDAIYLYSSRFQMSAPMHMCDGNDLADCNVSTYRPYVLFKNQYISELLIFKI